MTTNDLLNYHRYVCAKALEIAERKNHDYGASWESDRDTTLTDTIRHKIDRIINLENLGNQSNQVNESIEDNLLDIINYTVMRYYKEQNK